MSGKASCPLPHSRNCLGIWYSRFRGRFRNMRLCVARMMSILSLYALVMQTSTIFPPNSLFPIYFYFCAFDDLATATYIVLTLNFPREQRGFDLSVPSMQNSVSSGLTFDTSFVLPWKVELLFWEFTFFLSGTVSSVILYPTELTSQVCYVTLDGVISI